jgi:hypothetical protein
VEDAAGSAGRTSTIICQSFAKILLERFVIELEKESTKEFMLSQRGAPNIKSRNMEISNLRK